MADNSSLTSRRRLLRTLTAAPVAGVAAGVTVTPLAAKAVEQQALVTTRDTAGRSTFDNHISRLAIDGFWFVRQRDGVSLPGDIASADGKRWTLDRNQHVTFAAFGLISANPATDPAHNARILNAGAEWSSKTRCPIYGVPGVRVPVSGPIQIDSFFHYVGNGMEIVRHWPDTQLQAGVFRSRNFDKARIIKNIIIDGAIITDSSAKMKGSFLALCAHDLTIRNCRFHKTGNLWCSIIHGKDVIIKDNIIDTSQAKKHADCLHFGHLENATISGNILRSQDDALAITAMPVKWTAAGPDQPSRHIVIYGNVLSSLDANAFRLGIGGRRNDRYSPAYYHADISFFGNTFVDTSSTAPTYCINLLDPREYVDRAHSGIRIFDNIFRDSDATAINIIGNPNPGKRDNSAIRNWGSISITNNDFEFHGGKLVAGGGIESFEFSSNKSRRTRVSGANEFDLKQVSQIKLSGNEINANTTNRIIRLEDWTNIRCYQNTINGIAKAKSGYHIGQPNPYGESKIRIIGDEISGVEAGISATSPFTAARVHIDSVDISASKQTVTKGIGGRKRLVNVL